MLFTLARQKNGKGGFLVQGWHGNRKLFIGQTKNHIFIYKTFTYDKESDGSDSILMKLWWKTANYSRTAKPTPSYGPWGRCKLLMREAKEQI